MENLLFQPSVQEFSWVQSEQVAREFPMQPGTEHMFFSINEPIFYARSVDLNGNTAVFEIFDYTKREPPKQPTYATTDDLGALIQQMNSMQKMLEELTKSSS